MRTIKIWFMLVLLFNCVIAESQDFHFSQYFSSPSNINPALAGLTDGNFRAAVNYRNQSVSTATFTTYAFSIDGNINRGMLDGNHLGLGASFYQDVEESKGFSNTAVNFSVAYNLKVAKYPLQYIGFGFQAGILRKQININNAVFGNLYEKGINSDPIQYADYNSLKFDLSAGFSYILSAKKNYVINIGSSVFHINRPKYGAQGESALYMKSISYLSAEIMVAARGSVIPSFLFQKQGPSNELVTGFFGRVMFKKVYKRDAPLVDLYVGLQFRMVSKNDRVFAPESIVPNIRIEAYGFIVGFSYDVTLSSLGNLNRRRGGMEASVVVDLDFGNKSKPKNLRCPRF